MSFYLKIAIIEIVLYFSWLFNLIVNISPSLLKKIILKIFLKRFKLSTLLDQNIFFRNPFNIYIHKEVNINYGCKFFSSFEDGANGKIIMEDNVTLSPNVHIYTNSHETKSKEFKSIAKSVVIKKNAWICANSIILQGVIIGENSIICANSLVNKSIGSNEIWGGIPAKFIKKRIIY